MSAACNFRAGLLHCTPNSRYLLFLVKSEKNMVLKKRSNLLLVILVCGSGLMGLSACKSALLGETAFVVPENAEIRSSTAKASRTVGSLKRGDQVTIVEKTSEGSDSFVRITAPGNIEGWMIARNLITKSNADKSKEFAATLTDIPAQAIGKNKNSLKLRLTPDRSSDDNVLVQLPAGLSFELVDRETRPKAVEKNATPTPQPQASGKPGAPEDKESGASYEIWYKVRVIDNPIVPGGYVYGGSIELDTPYEIKYFLQPDKKIVGWQKLGSVKDEKGEEHFHYVIFEKSYNKDDEKSDFDYVHIVGFDSKNKSVAYYNVLRDSRRGTFPVIVNVEGSRATFKFNALDASNQETSVQYVTETTDKGRLRATPPDGSINPKDARRK